MICGGTSSVFVTPFTFALFLSIHNSIVVLPNLIVTFLSEALQSTVPPKDSITGLIGSSVLPLLMIGGESNVLVAPLTVNVDLPTVSLTMTPLIPVDVGVTLTSFDAADCVLSL